MSDHQIPPASAEIRDQIVALVPRLRRFCMALTRSVDDGDDLAQATLERALGRLGQWQEDTKIDRWMLTIAKNLFIDQVRARQRRGSAVGLETIADVSGEDGRTVVEDRSELAAARRAIMALPDDQRMLVGLVILDNQSYRDAAEILGIPIGTVMSRLARARRSIEAFMEARATSVPS